MKRLSVVVFLLAAVASGLYAKSKIGLYNDVSSSKDFLLETQSYNDKKHAIILRAGSKVKILAVGREDTIGGIKSNWVTVEVQRNAYDKDGNKIPYGVIGKCFAVPFTETESTTYKADYAGGNGTVISEREDSRHRITIRKHMQKLRISEFTDAKQRILYASTTKSNVVCALNNDDEVKITEIHYITEKKDNFHYIWLKAYCNGREGFLCYSEPYYSDYYRKMMNDSSFDPYGNNTWEIIETIQSANEKWTVRKLRQDLTVYSSEDRVALLDKPGKENSKVIGYVPASYTNGQGQINIETEAVTEEVDKLVENERWVRTTFDGKTGWIYGSVLSAERGGPKYLIPEALISLSLSAF